MNEMQIDLDYENRIAQAIIDIKNNIIEGRQRGR